MGKVFWIVLIALTIHLQSCSDEGPATPQGIECAEEVITLGTIHLDPGSHPFVSYTGEEILVFKNDLGDEVRFEPMNNFLNHIFFESWFELLCESGDSNIYMAKREIYNFSKRCDVLDLSLLMSISPVHSQELPLFNDEFNLYLYGSYPHLFLDTSVHINITTSLRGNDKFSNPIRFIGYKNGFVTDTVLLNVPIHNAYYTIKPPDKLLRSIFYTKEQGLVAFHDLEDVMWVLDRFE